MNQLKLEELVSYLFFSQVANSHECSESDLVRLVENIGLDNANHLKHRIVRYVQEGHNVHVIRALLVA